MSSATSVFSAVISRCSQRSPQIPMSSTIGASSAPARVRWYSWPGPCERGRRSSTPARSRLRRRLVSSEADISGTPRWMSLKRWLPATSSRTTSGVQRSVSTSAAWAIGQNWP